MAYSTKCDGHSNQGSHPLLGRGAGYVTELPKYLLKLHEPSTVETVGCFPSLLNNFLHIFGLTKDTKVWTILIRFLSDFQSLCSALSVPNDGYKSLDRSSLDDVLSVGASVFAWVFPHTRDLYTVNLGVTQPQRGDRWEF